MSAVALRRRRGGLRHADWRGCCEKTHEERRAEPHAQLLKVLYSRVWFDVPVSTAESHAQASAAAVTRHCSSAAVAAVLLRRWRSCPCPELRPSDAGSSDRSAWRGGQGSTQASIDPAYGFNVEVCRQIAVDRPIPDARPAACKSERFDDAALEPAAIIIVEFNEARCTLHRTLHSVIARSPAALLREIVLVDDYSDWPIDPDICALPKVSAHRNTRREGLIRSRMLGVGYSSAPVLVFLDSHVEVNVGWLQPLLAQIAADRTRVVAPIIDDIDYKTFMYKMVVLEQLGHFDWHLTFEWKPLSAANRARQGGEHKPFDTPIHAGGLYAIARSWFDELGAYDRGMDIWGFENAELSFRSWQCGGTLQMLPCSRVGHVFRRHNPYLSASASPLSRNRYRAAVVWMDEYAQLVSGVSAFRPGPEDERWLDERRAIRLRCRPFEWYLREVVPERDVPRNTTALVAGTGRTVVVVIASDVCGRARGAAGLGCSSLARARWHGRALSCTTTRHSVWMARASRLSRSRRVPLRFPPPRTRGCASEEGRLPLRVAEPALACGRARRRWTARRIGVGTPWETMATLRRPLR